MLLALDTATDTVGLALYHADGPRAEIAWAASGGHGAALMPEVERALSLAGIRPSDLTAAAVTLGPGSFTGLRIALACAKGLVAVLGIPLLGVPTLEAMAHPHRHLGAPLYPVIRAGRGRFCTARHEPQRVEEFRVGSLDQIASSQGVWLGELREAERRQLEELLPSGSHVLGPLEGWRRPAAVAQIAWERLLLGESDDAATLSPIYLPAAGAPA